jgi:hypothetical protein
MKTKEAINILYYAVEYYDMMYNSGDSKHDKKEKNKVWKALNYVGDQLYKEKGEYE